MDYANKNESIVLLVKGILISIVASIICVLVFSVVLAFTGGGDLVVKIVNQIIKTFSIFLGCTYSVKREKGLLKGLLTGGIAGIITSLIFGLILSKLSFIAILWDTVFGIVLGCLVGVIMVNRRVE